MTSWTEETYTTSDGYTCRYRRYPAAPGERRGVSPPVQGTTGGSVGEVVCLHGIQSHAGWYEYSCIRLAEAGYTVSFLDRRGAGRNEQARGDAPGFRRLMADVAEFLQPLRERFPTRPVVLLGISWGCKLAVGLQRRYPGLNSALVLLCPGFFARVQPTWGQKLGICWSRLIQPTCLFPIPLNDPELFTASPRWLEFLRHDPLALHQATARLLLESARMDVYIRLAAPYVRVPTLLMLAGKDRIVDNRRIGQLVAGFPVPAPPSTTRTRITHWSLSLSLTTLSAT